MDDLWRVGQEWEKKGLVQLFGQQCLFYRHEAEREQEIARRYTEDEGFRLKQLKGFWGEDAEFTEAKVDEYLELAQRFGVSSRTDRYESLIDAMTAMFLCDLEGGGKYDTCRECHNTYLVTHGAQRYCCQRCAKSANNRKSAENMRARRSSKSGVQTGIQATG